MSEDPGVRFVDWVADQLQQAPLARDLPRKKLEALAYDLAVETQIVLRLEDATGDIRAQLETLHPAMQFQARTLLFSLGLIRADQVERTPRPDGWDLAVSELFGLSVGDLLTRCRQMEVEEQDAG